MLSTWEFNVLDIYNYRTFGPKKTYFDFIMENHYYIKGDIFEFGVYRGRSLLATALLLKELGSTKKVYGFDTFYGFPKKTVSDMDNWSYFEHLFEIGEISNNHYQMVLDNVEYCKIMGRHKFNSKSGDFSKTSYKSINERAKLLNLDNIYLVRGTFEDSIADADLEDYPDNIMCALLDCDLYESYKTVLPFAWEKLSDGGLIYLDEYFSLKFPGARVACNEFFEPNQLKLLKISSDGFERWGAIK